MSYKICSDVSKVTTKFNTLHSFCRLYQTHYEVLKLSKNCSPKEIKSAFIKLSKQHHPDVNKSKQSHAKFQQINEAYKVLGKPESRRDYDLGLSQDHPHAAKHYQTERYYYEPRTRNPYSDPHFWANRDKARDEYYRQHPYYGIDGIPRLSNEAIIFFCIVFSLIGMGLQYIAITSQTFRRDALIRRSLETEQILNQTKETAVSNGNAAQLEALKIKLLGQTVKECDNK
ncbi:dnaJ-like protein 60 isoform X2 [Zophobas morio]|uniref:dnaJ-like protein 60 isoform X2 n=1 Tax=Zophobas morio TaxID=2755281 RepID=UPI003082859F